jgi:hypothetical protein
MTSKQPPLQLALLQGLAVHIYIVFTFVVYVWAHLDILNHAVIFNIIPSSIDVVPTEN